MNISIQRLNVTNLAGKFKVDIYINCTNMSYKNDELIIKGMYEVLSYNYPLEFSRGSVRDSYVDIKGCSYIGSEFVASPIVESKEFYEWTIWRIESGKYYSLT